LTAAHRAGGIAALNRELTRTARHGGRPHRFRQIPRRRRDLRGPHASAAAVNWLALSGSALVKEIFKALAIQSAKSLAGVAAQKAGTAALGWVLAAFGHADLLKDQTMLEIRDAVQALGKEVTQIRGDLALSGFSTLVHQTDRTIGEIKHASSQLALLTNMPAKDPTKAAFTDTIVSYIGTNLIDAASILNQSLGTSVPLADNLIKSASRLVSQRVRFFGPASSEQVKSVYDYFAAYQAQLAMLLQEYYHAKPNVYSPANAEANLVQVEGNVNGQAGSLKPAVPPNTVIDIKSRQMWITDSTLELTLRSLAEIRYKSTATRKTKVIVTLRREAGPTGVSGFPFTNWELPTFGAFQQLIEGSSGSPLDWLQKQAGFTRRLLDAGGTRKWVRDGFSPRRYVFAAGLDLTTFQLSDGKRHLQVLEWNGQDWKGVFDRMRAGLMYVRKVPSEESYWWSG
jgi:hypothetical protein